MNGLFKTRFAAQQPYSELVRALSGRPLTKAKRIFDNSKVTDHHAIIPTGVVPMALTDMERNVFDLVARRFIAAFYPDCHYATTTVLGDVEDIEFKATAKEIISQGWHVCYEGEAKTASPEENEVLSVSFKKGESGPHQPTLTEKQTTPPKHYTEATLLRAMETAGKFVEDEDLRAAMKQNGIGRPSSRAGIIETLFKRNYITRSRRNLLATDTAFQLIDTIQEELLKSPELTGIWEKKLRNIEQKTYDPMQFINELKQQITQIVYDVLRDNRPRTT